MSKKQGRRPGRRGIPAKHPPTGDGQQKTRAPKILRELSPGRRWALRLGLALVVPSLLLVALECGLRMGGYGYPTNLALEVPGRDSYGTNLRFGWRFFPRAIARVPLLFSFPADKSPDTYRIFVLGASAAQGYPNGSFSFARILEVMLEQQFPGTTFEVVNSSIAAINSHVVLPIARECAGYDPDLFIVYLGNNEVIGPHGIGSSATRRAGGLGTIRWGIWLRTTRTGQLLQQLAEKLSRQDKLLEQWGGMEMFTERQIASDDPDLQQVYSHFEQNLRDICAAALDVDCEVLLCTVPTNSWDSAPFASLHRPDLTAEQTTAWDAALAAGLAAATAGRHTEALASFEQARDLDDRHAELHHHLGTTQLALGDTSRAREHFHQARELDVLRFRADDRINQIIRDLASTETDDTVRLMDAERIFSDSGPDLHVPLRRRRFYEHVHLTFTGNYELACCVFPEVVAVLPPAIRQRAVAPPTVPDLAGCAERLVYTEWAEYKIITTILTLLTQPPFPDQYDHAEKLAAWQTALDEIFESASPAKHQATIKAHADAVAANPDDLLMRLNYMELLKEIKQSSAAGQQWTIIEQSLPSLDWARQEDQQGRLSIPAPAR
ncbi:MAG: tetratricopeptide repeat protein [bacterium]